MAVWLLLQSSVFALGSFQIELASGSAGFPRPAERLTPYHLVTVQIGAAALFFPALLRPWAIAALAIAAIWAFQLAAAALAGTDFRLATAAAAYVSAWLTGLAILAYAIRSRREKPVAVSIVALTTWGGAMGGYYSHEFGPPPSSTAIPTSAHFGPIYDSINALSTGRWSGNLAFIALFLTVSVAAGVARRVLELRVHGAQGNE